MANHSGICFEVDGTIQVDKPDSAMFFDPIENITNTSSFELDISRNYTRVDAKCNVVKLNGQLCSLADFGTNVTNEHGCIERDVVVAVE